MEKIFNEKLNQNVVVLDGGFGTQLTRHVGEKIDGDPLWSSRFLFTDEKAVIKTHLDFLNAGADLVVTNTYQADVELFKKHLPLTGAESFELIKKAVGMARQACKQYENQFPDSPKKLVVGSVGPYGASLHNGSEYKGSYGKTTSVETLRQWHRPRLQALIEAGVDLLALETIPCRIEAEMLVRLLKDEFPATKAWLSFSISQDGKTIADGSDFQEAARFCYDLNPEQLVAVGINCLAPSFVENLITGLNNNRKEAIPIIAYPNNGDIFDAERGWLDKPNGVPLESYVEKWLSLGVRWVGGCCRVYDKDITKIRREVEKWINNSI